MDFRFTEEEEAFRKEVLDFLQESPLAGWEVDPDGHYERAVEELHHFELEMQRKLAAKGWRELIWPLDRVMKIHSIALVLPLRISLMPGFNAVVIPLSPT